MAQVPIKRTIERVPGGMRVVPLFVGAVLGALAPHARFSSPAWWHRRVTRRALPTAATAAVPGSAR